MRSVKSNSIRTTKWLKTSSLEEKLATHTQTPETISLGNIASLGSSGDIEDRWRWGRPL
jgi:hypothetical protein